MDRGAWWAAVPGAAKSQTRLSTHTAHITRGHSVQDPLPATVLLPLAVISSPSSCPLGANVRRLQQGTQMQTRFWCSCE